MSDYIARRAEKRQRRKVAGDYADCHRSPANTAPGEEKIVGRLLLPSEKAPERGDAEQVYEHDRVIDPVKRVHVLIEKFPSRRICLSSKSRSRAKANPSGWICLPRRTDRGRNVSFGEC